MAGASSQSGITPSAFSVALVCYPLKGVRRVRVPSILVSLFFHFATRQNCITHLQNE